MAIGGPAFLLLYIVMLVVAGIVSAIVTRARRPQGRVVDRPDPDTLAWLSGGSARFYDAAAARHLAAGDLMLRGSGRFATPDGRELGWAEVKRDHAGMADTLERRLRGQGLVLRVDEVSRLRWAAVLPFLVVGTVGLIRLVLGIAAGRPIGLLFMLLVLTLVVTLIRGSRIDRRTAGGVETLARAKGSLDRLRRAPLQDEMGMAVALFGTAVLAGSAYAGFHQFRAPATTTSSDDGGCSSSDSSSCGSNCGSSCGGGGCGG